MTYAQRPLMAVTCDYLMMSDCFGVVLSAWVCSFKGYCRHILTWFCTAARWTGVQPRMSCASSSLGPPSSRMTSTAGRWLRMTAWCKHVRPSPSFEARSVPCVIQDLISMCCLALRSPWRLSSHPVDTAQP